MTTPDPRLMAVADGLMDFVHRASRQFADWRAFSYHVEERDAILAALRSERVRGEESMRDREWQPIETAPKGRRILLRVRPREHLGHMTEAVAVGEWHESPNKDRWRWDGWSTDLGPFRNATGWMPLPTLPTTDQETSNG